MYILYFVLKYDAICVNIKDSHSFQEVHNASIYINFFKNTEMTFLETGQPYICLMSNVSMLLTLKLH